MPEPHNDPHNDAAHDASHDPGLKDSVRRGLSEGSRHIPRRVRELPGLAVRTAVLGLGKVMQVTEQFRQQDKQDKQHKQGRSPEGEPSTDITTGIPATGTSETPATGAGGAAQETQTAQPAQETQPAQATEPARKERTGQAEQAQQAAGAEPGGGATSPPEASPEAAEAATAAPGATGEEATPADDDGLPVPKYDTLTVGSLRARLRYLTISDLGKLLAYERTHANRSNVVTMYENRVLKLKQQSDS